LVEPRAVPPVAPDGAADAATSTTGGTAVVEARAPSAESGAPRAGCGPSPEAGTPECSARFAAGDPSGSSQARTAVAVRERVWG
jgi:hypothetical protein